MMRSPSCQSSLFTASSTVCPADDGRRDGKSFGQFAFGCVQGLAGMRQRVLADRIGVTAQRSDDRIERHQ